MNHDLDVVSRVVDYHDHISAPSVPVTDDLRRGRRRVRRHRSLVAGGVALAVASVVAAVSLATGDSAQHTQPLGPSGVVRAAPNGWVAVDTYQGGGDIYLVRPGEHARRLEVAGTDAANDACPAWSPDGSRLMFGRLTGSAEAASSDAELVIVPVSPDGATSAPKIISLDGFEALGGSDDFPCGTWAPDGRWVALRGPGAVWVVDTQTGAIRRLPGLRPTDLEWRPGTDELAIAGDIGSSPASDWSSTPVTVYSVSTGELNHLSSVVTMAVAWSPDGSTLALERPGDQQTGPDVRWHRGPATALGLVNADGTHERLLVADLDLGVHGIGPVWSPTGDRIAYQRQHKWSEEGTDVVLVSVADGTQTVIEPPKTGGPDGSVWYPYNITWSPDGTTLLYTAFSSNGNHGNAVVSVPADAPRRVTVLTDLPPVTSHRLEPWAPIQAWGRQPG